MTTGYDCRDILNICMMRPVYSPSEFIQMKEGTRKFNFADSWMTESERPDDIQSEKTKFLLFDFCRIMITLKKILIMMKF